MIVVVQREDEEEERKKRRVKASLRRANIARACGDFVVCTVTYAPTPRFHFGYLGDFTSRLSLDNGPLRSLSLFGPCTDFR